MTPGLTPSAISRIALQLWERIVRDVELEPGERLELVTYDGNHLLYLPDDVFKIAAHRFNEKNPRDSYRYASVTFSGADIAHLERSGSKSNIVDYVASKLSYLVLRLSPETKPKG